MRSASRAFWDGASCRQHGLDTELYLREASTFCRSGRATASSNSARVTGRELAGASSRRSSSSSWVRSWFRWPKSNRERALGDAGTREGWQQGAASETTPVHAALTMRSSLCRPGRSPAAASGQRQRDGASNCPSLGTTESICSTASTVGGRTDFRMAWTLEAPVERLRTEARIKPRNAAIGVDPAHAAAGRMISCECTPTPA